MKKADLVLGIYLLAAIIFFIVPIPSFLLDGLLALNIGIALSSLLHYSHGKHLACQVFQLYCYLQLFLEFR